MKKTLFSALLIITASTQLMVYASNESSALKGKDFVTKGKLGALSGTLFQQDGEWYLRSSDKNYELHIGNHLYRAETGINLKSEQAVDVKGFIYEDDVSVCTININNKEYRFRKDDGKPMWAGKGNGRNRKNHDE